MYFEDGKRKLGNEEDSIQRYQEMLKKYQETQGMLSDMGLPEETQDPVQDMIDKTKQESKLVDSDLAKLELEDKQAKKLSKEAKLDDNIDSGFNMTPERKELLLNNRDRSIKTGTNGDEERQIIEDLKKNPSEGIPFSEVEKDFPEENPDAEILKSIGGDTSKVGTHTVDSVLDKVQDPESPVVRKKQILDRLAEARKQRNLQEAFADISEGVSQAAAGYVGGGLVNLKPDTSYTDALRKRAQRGVTETEADIKKEKEELAKKEALDLKAQQLKRQGILDNLNSRYKEAQIAKLGDDIKKSAGLPGFNDPNSELSKSVQKKMKDAGFEGDLSGWSAADIEKNQSALTRKIVTKTAKDRESRLAAKQAWQIGERDEVSDKQLESISKIDEIQNFVNRIKDLKKKVNTGFYSQTTHELGKYAPLDMQDKDQAALSQLTGNTLADYIKTISGAAVSEEEAQRLKLNIPTMDDDDKVFNRKLKEFEKTLNETLDTRLVNMKDYQGRILPENIQKRLDSKHGKSQDKKIKEYADKYGMTYAAAEQLLRSRGYGK